MAYREWKHPSSKFNQLYKRLRELPGIFHGPEDDVDEYQQVGELQPQWHEAAETPPSAFREWLDARLDQKASDERQYFLQQVFIVYLRLGSTHAVARATGICQTIVSKSVKTYKTQLENEFYNTDPY